jgi:hypothetical protein
MRNKTGVLSAAGVGATIAMVLPPVVGSKTRSAIAGAVRSAWRFVLHLTGRPMKRVSRKRVSRRPVSRAARRAS